MRVLHLSKTTHGGGWIVRLAREMVRHGFDVHVAAPDDGPNASAYREAGATLHGVQTDLPVTRPDRFPARARAIRRLVDAVRPDLIVSHFVGTTLAARLALGRSHPIPRLFQVPGPLHLEHALFRQLDLRTAGDADYWLGTCRWTGDTYRAAGVPAARVFDGYVTLDPEPFMGRDRGKLRSLLGLPAGQRLVGMVALFYPPKRYLGYRRGIKGHEDFIDAIAELRRERDDVTGVVIGGAWAGGEAYERSVQAYARERCGDAVRFTGMRADVAELYPDLDVVVHPSLSENVGGVAESLFAEVPTIASRVGGMPDFIIPGETGWLVPPRSPSSIAQAVREALADPIRAREMARVGHGLAVDQLGARSAGLRVSRLVERIVAEHGRSRGEGRAEPAD